MNVVDPDFYEKNDNGVPLIRDLVVDDPDLVSVLETREFLALVLRGLRIEKETKNAER
jgi:hypothetical protein